MNFTHLEIVLKIDNSGRGYLKPVFPFQTSINQPSAKNIKLFPKGGFSGVRGIA